MPGRPLPEQEKRLRAIMMVQKVVGEGKTKKQVAKEMGISHDTVEKTLKWARQANIFVEYEHRLYDELVPLAHEAIKMALADGDAQVALKIMESVGLGPNRMKQTKAQVDDQEGLYGEIARLRAGAIVDVSPQRRLAGADEAGAEVVDVPDELDERGVHRPEATSEGEGQTGPQDVDGEVAD